jgi:hypothetical protein
VTCAGTPQDADGSYPARNARTAGSASGTATISADCVGSIAAVWQPA